MKEVLFTTDENDTYVGIPDHIAENVGLGRYVVKEGNVYWSLVTESLEVREERIMKALGMIAEGEQNA